MLLDENLLLSANMFCDLESSSLSGTTTRGLYSPRQFLLRLREDVHQTLTGIEEGIHLGRLSDNQLMAFSTYLHETIHWWQHVGSNFGLLSSLKFPAQSHMNYSHLRTLLREKGAFKSVLEYEKSSNGYAAASVIINNWYDIELASQIAFDPLLTKKIVKNPYFESQGHSYEMLWGAAISSLAGTVDPDFMFLPDIRTWESGFADLRSKKAEGFYYGSPVHVAPVGTKAIFEGQARFSQLQYLSNASGRTLAFDDFEKANLLKGIYAEAFNLFLSILKEERPDYADSPLVALFLLLCDMSINPTNGFPFNIINYETFVRSNDPGARFYFLCHIVANKHSELKQAIREYSRDEYITVSGTLAEELKWFSPIESAACIVDWTETNDSVKRLLADEEVYIYQPLNHPISLFFSKFLVFQRDKLIYPQFFCWPGMNMVELLGNTVTLPLAWDLFERHKALFVDDASGNVYHSAHRRHSDEVLDKNLNDFFSWYSVYDLTGQWIIKPGGFAYDFKWLSSKYTPVEIKGWADKNFESSFQIKPDDFRILTRQ